MIAGSAIIEELLEEEFELRPYFEGLLRNLKWIIGAAFIAALVTLMVSFLIPPTYEATTLDAVTDPRQIGQYDC